MVYTSQQWQGSYTEQMDLPMLLDPSLLRAARQIYRTYYEVHPDQTQRPYGVAIDRFTHRGKLILEIKSFCYPKNVLCRSANLRQKFIRVLFVVGCWLLVVYQQQTTNDA